MYASKMFYLFQLLSFPIPGCPRYKILMNETKRTEKYLNMTFLYKVSGTAVTGIKVMTG